MVYKKNEAEYQSFLSQVGQRIKFEREKAGFTQEQMAELNGMDYKYFQRIEYGEVNITMKTLFKIAKNLKVAPYKLIDGAIKV